MNVNILRRFPSIRLQTHSWYSANQLIAYPSYHQRNHSTCTTRTCSNRAGRSNAVTHSKKGWQKEKGHNPRHHVIADQYGRTPESTLYQDRADCKFNCRLRVVKGSWQLRENQRRADYRAKEEKGTVRFPWLETKKTPVEFRRVLYFERKEGIGDRKLPFNVIILLV